jgi:predicted Zn-dependent protease
MKVSLQVVLLTSLLSGVSLQSAAFDFKGAIKDAAEKQIGIKNEPTTSENKNSATVPPIAQETPPAFNWKNPSREEEIALGREITGNLLGAAPLVKDEALQKYVNSVGRWVASQSERPDLPWRFGVIDSDDLNAFAAPGGYVVMTKGLYKKLTNEAQLAGVLGHEIGHVVKKHQLKVLQKQQLLNLGASFLSDQIAKDNVLATKVIGTGAEISARSLDKGAEYEADRLGLSYATRAGYEPFGLTDVLQTLGQTGKNDSSVALLFKTHPHPDERLTTLANAVGNKLDNIQNGKTLENRFYPLKN